MPLPDEEPFNILFVQMVEKYKCLYDTSYPTYSSRDEQEKAWNSLAEAFSSTGSECKSRWKNLRGGLTRYIKRKQEHGDNAKLIRQFYLWNDMQFILPFLKSRNHAGSWNLNSADDSEDAIDVDNSVVEPEVDILHVDRHANRYMAEETAKSNDAVENDSFISSILGSTRSGTKRTAVDVLEVAVADLISRKLGSGAESADLSFFKSLLPDMNRLNASQKRKVKVGILQLLDDISCEEPGSHNSSVISGYSSATEPSQLQYIKEEV